MRKCLIAQQDNEFLSLRLNTSTYFVFVLTELQAEIVSLGELEMSECFIQKLTAFCFFLWAEKYLR